MKTSVITSIILMAAFTTSVLAAQFESVIEAIAIHSTETHTNNGWENTNKIRGVKWQWPYHQSGAHDSTMLGTSKFGKDKNPNIGATKVTISGARTFISEIQIEIQNEGENPSERAVKALFGVGKVQQISTSCDSDDMSYADATYYFEKPGYKPVFLKYVASWGAAGAGGIDIKIANSLGDALGACKPTKN
jgi:hypothetical protein